MVSKKVLIILSDAHSFPLEKKTKAGTREVDKPSGFFLMELAKPLEKILQAGYEVTFASPKGQEPKADPTSDSLLAFAGNFYERKKEHKLIERMKKDNGFGRPRPFSTISDEELDGFAGVFIPGGHAPLKDLGSDKELGRILRHFHAKSKPTAAICHGPYAFLSTKKAGDGSFVYKGYKITSWSDAEETMMERVLRGEIPKVESSLRESGAIMVEGPKEKVGETTVDREVISGGNPMAANSLGNQFLSKLSAAA